MSQVIPIIISAISAGAAFASACSAVNSLRTAQSVAKTQALANIYNVWKDVGDIDPDVLFSTENIIRGANATEILKEAQALQYTAVLWDQSATDKAIILQFVYDDFMKVYDNFVRAKDKKIERTHYKESDFLSERVKRVHDSMLARHDC